MEMQLDKKQLKSLRLSRAWSQTQLSEVSGLSLRTIQRIENSGNASLESVKALASVYEVNVESLRVNQLNQSGFADMAKLKIASVIVSLLIALGTVFVFPVSAKSIMVDVALSKPGEKVITAQLLNRAGRESEFVADGLLKLTIKSVRESENKVRMYVSLYSLALKEPVLLGKPELVTKNNQPAEIQFDDYLLSLTPHM